MYYCRWSVYFWLVVAILTLLSACSPEEQVKLDIYFDSAAYMQGEIEAIKKQVHYASASLALNGEVEKKEKISLIEESLDQFEQIFDQVNINQAKLRGEYQVDTFWILDPISAEQIEIWNYTSSNDKLKVKWMQVYSNGSLKASIADHNFLFSYEKEIYYEKQKKMSAISWQKTLGMDTLHIFNELEFIPED
ncbi:MAG: hypothetical protein KDC82_07355 [Bacteroidetes bacterium]|nr:hypothetical protein [Bacteroidota bacterium]